MTGIDNFPSVTERGAALLLPDVVNRLTIISNALG